MSKVLKDHVEKQSLELLAIDFNACVLSMTPHCLTRGRS